MNISDRLSTFLDRGYRPNVKTHLLPGSPVEGWSTITYTEAYSDGEQVTECIGWVVDAWPIHAGKQRIIGAVARTLEDALDYAEKELDKYA